MTEEISVTRRIHMAEGTLEIPPVPGIDGDIEQFGKCRLLLYRANKRGKPTKVGEITAVYMYLDEDSSFVFGIPVLVRDTGQVARADIEFRKVHPSDFETGYVRALRERVEGLVTELLPEHNRSGQVSRVVPFGRLV